MNTIIKELFRTYLANCVQSRRSTDKSFIIGKSTVDSYVSFVEVDKLFDYAPEKWAKISSIYDIVSSKEIFNIIEQLFNDKDFGVKDSKESSQYFRSNAIKQYYCFLKAREIFENTKIKNYQVLQYYLFNHYRPYITAIKSKPFLLLAGISGTGKSRIVRELARACWEEGSEEYKAQKPKNFEMIQVKPNWHDSSELIGYVSRIDGEKFVVGPFLKFMAKAIQNPDVPYFLCLDEMNLAPVEQYFAEYLSVIESRKWDNGEIVTDPIIDYEPTDAYKSLIDQLFYDDETRKKYLTKENGERLRIPQNLIVVGTVNMDETTFSFSRKVLDRAMTIEMNEVDLEGGLDKKYESIGKLGAAELIGNAVEGVDVYADNKGVCDRVINYLKAINGELEGTPFKVAYRTRNEFLLYVVNNLPYNKDENGEDIAQEVVMARALDEITSMKILSRIEGDTEKIGDLLDRLKEVIKKQLNEISSGKEYSGTKDEEGTEYSVSLAKLKEMKLRLKSGYTSFWS